MDYLIDDMSSVVISIQLPMYGYAMTKLEKESERIKASWIAIADGGSLIDEGEMIIQKPFIPLATEISKADISTQEDESSGRDWSWAIYNASGDAMRGQNAGHWPLNYLENVLRIIEQDTNDSSITEWIRDILEL